MAKAVELRRHTANEGDALSSSGIEDALEIGARLTGGYDLLVSSGAQRSTQTLACYLAALGERVALGTIVEPLLRSEMEDRWFTAYKEAGSGALEALRGADPELVEADSARLAEGLRRVFGRLPEGGRALAVGHSPTNEAAVMGLTGVVLPPMAKGAGVLVVEDGGSYRVESLERRPRR